MQKEESRKLTEAIVAALEDKKAEKIDVIEIDEISPLADYFIIAVMLSITSSTVLMHFAAFFL